MRILIINKYLYPKGGDALCTLNTGRLLKSHGHEIVYWGMSSPENPVYPYEKLFTKNIDLNAAVGLIERLKIASNLLYSFDAKRKVEQLVQMVRPDIVHLNNFAHQISPSILQVFRHYNIPTVMTLHDYKMVCASYLMIHEGRICEACKNGKYNMCFWKKCVKDSRLKSLLNTIEMYLHHKIMHIYDLIDLYIAPSVFLKQKLYDMGFTKKVIYLPNFVNERNIRSKTRSKNNRFLYFGRLSFEKGLTTLIKAVRGIDIELHIVGTGLHEYALKCLTSSEKAHNVLFMGYRSGHELAREISEALAVIVPSEWYENNPRAVLEAFSAGKPVIGARIGGIPELVIDYETGLTFHPGDIADLKKSILYCSSNKDKMMEMGKRAQQFAKENFSSTKHYNMLMDIYNSIRNQ